MELFFDDTWIDRMAGVRKTLGQPQKEPSPILMADRPWETAGIFLFHSVMQDVQEGKYKLWYRAAVPAAALARGATNARIETSEQEHASRQSFLCYAESADGIVWTKPDLGLYEFQGSAANNILQPIGSASVVFGNIVKDPHDPNPNRRYKAIEFDEHPTHALTVRGTRARGVCVAYSADGLRWPDGPTLIISADEMTDSNLLLPYRDPRTGKWVNFMRPRTHPKRRFIGYAESDDFERWSWPRMLLTPDANDAEYIEFYGLNVVYLQPYYVGTLWVFHNNPYFSPMTNELVWSRDGQHFTRALPGAEFLPLGPAGSFDSRMVSVASVLEHDDELWLYYNGANHDHGSDRGQKMPPGKSAAPGEKPNRAVGLARIRKGMFCGYGTPYEGMIETKYLTNYGGPGPRALAAIGTDGWLKAEILDHYGNVVPGFGREQCALAPRPDGTIGFVWGEQRLAGRLDDVSPEGGKIQRVIKLRLFLQNATVFGVGIGE